MLQETRLPRCREVVRERGGLGCASTCASTRLPTQPPELRYARLVSASPRLIGQLLSTGLGGYAGSAARALLEQEPEIEDRTGTGAFDLWKQHFEERLSELAAALSFEKPELFAAGSAWARAAYEAREAPIDHFARGLGTLEAVPAEAFDPPFWRLVVPPP